MNILKLPTFISVLLEGVLDTYGDVSCHTALNSSTVKIKRSSLRCPVGRSCPAHDGVSDMPCRPALSSAHGGHPLSSLNLHEIAGLNYQRQ